MSYLPDCRSNENYNDKYLNERDKAEVNGYDWCTEQVVDCFFDNLDLCESDHLTHILSEEIREDEHKEYEWEYTTSDAPSEKRTIKTYGDLLRSMLLEYIEAERNERIVSMIDSMDEDEYAAIKEKVDGRSKSEERERAKED